MADPSALKLAVVAALRETEPDLASEVECLRKNLPDPTDCPASRAIVEAYLSKIEAFVSYIRAGTDGIQRCLEESPNLVSEIDELKTLIYRSKRPIEAGREFISGVESTVGDWLVEMGMSYSETSEALQRAKRVKTGAPANERHITLQALDLKLSKKLSYAELAQRLCDCGSKQHGQLCREKFRKRITLLEKLLSKYNISV